MIYAIMHPYWRYAQGFIYKDVNTICFKQKSTAYAYSEPYSHASNLNIMNEIVRYHSLEHQIITLASIR